MSNSRQPQPPCRLPSVIAVPASLRASRLRNRVVAIMAVAILIPSMLGFVNKFRELVNVYQGEADGAFAIAPILNYVLASLGFLMLLGWAAMNGMFRNIEGPKYDMLETERQLDAQDPAAKL